MKLLSSLLFLLPTTILAAQYKTLQGRTVHAVTTERHLQFFPGQADECPTQLSLCEIVTAPIAEPAQEWISFIQLAVGETSSLVTDFVNVVDALTGNLFELVATETKAAADSSGFADLFNLVEVLVNIIQSLSGVDGTNPLLVLGLLDTILREMGDLSETLAPFVAIIESITNLITSITDGPIAILQAIIEIVIAFLGAFATNLLSLTIFPSSDPACTGELMLCDYTRMAMTLIPGLFAGLFAVKMPESGEEELAIEGGRESATP